MSVIVCAYNEGGYIQRCLESLLSQSRPPDDILVVNNASTDDTRKRSLLDAESRSN